MIDINPIVQEKAGTPDAVLYYGKDIWDVKSGSSITIDQYLDNVQGDAYQEYVFPVRAIRDKDARQEKKKKCPFVCISGNGNEKSNNGINNHSGYIGIDIDDADPISIKKLLRSDPYLYACFNSISDTGVCLIFKIEGKRHTDAFRGLQEYLFEKYGLIVDELCKDISRARYVSYDPAIIRNEHCKVFKLYPKKESSAIRQTKIKSAVGVAEDFENIILKEIETRRIDIVPSYGAWRNAGFAFAHQFGEAGRDYFHRISIFGNYNSNQCDKQYDACLQSESKGHFEKSIITINYFYWLCKSAGIAIESDDTILIKRTAYTQKKAGVGKENVIKYLAEAQQLSPERTTDIVTQVFDKDVIVDDVSDIECIKEYLRANYNLRINEITNRLENEGKELTNCDIHSIELDIKEKFPKTDYTTIDKILDSNFIVKYNPIFDFFEKNLHRGREGSIDELFSCIKTNTGEGIFDGYSLHYGKKWLVGMVACLYEYVSPLMLILCGRDQGTGKTYFFENFLPNELKRYCTIKNLSSLTSDTFKRDMDIAISKYWLIYDDEMSGKSKRDQGAIKALLSTGQTNVRAAYAKAEEGRKRIATFGGTTNDLQILGDHTGNRRFIPIEVLEIDFERKDMIDPVEYIMEAYHLYHAGFDYKVLGKDMKILNDCTNHFTQISAELEMVMRFYEAPKSKNDNAGVYRTATEIKNKLESATRDKMNYNKLSAALKAIGVEGEQKKMNKVFGTWYFVVEKSLGADEPVFENQSVEILEPAPF